MKQSIRDNVAQILEAKGFNVKTEKLTNEEHKIKLCSLFWREFQQTLKTDNVSKLHVHYAEMLEVIRSLMVVEKASIKELDFDGNQAIQWYEKTAPEAKRLASSRVDVLQKFNELLIAKTEAVKDQLKDILASFRRLIENNGLSFVDVEKTRRNIYKKLGGYNTKTYLAGVSKPRPN